MNREHIKAILKSHALPEDSYWVLMGAAMVLYGIKEETSDIDLGCTDALFERIRHAGYPVTTSGTGKKKIRLSDEVVIYRDWECGSVECIDGLPVCDINTIIKNKQELSREKDLVDLQLIACYQGDD